MRWFGFSRLSRRSPGPQPRPVVESPLATTWSRAERIVHHPPPVDETPTVIAEARSAAAAEAPPVVYAGPDAEVTDRIEPVEPAELTEPADAAHPTDTVEPEQGYRFTESDARIRMWLADGTEMELDPDQIELSHMRDVAATLIWRAPLDSVGAEQLWRRHRLPHQRDASTLS